MKHMYSFEWTGETFEERIGEPEAFEAAVGKIAMNFADLEHTVDHLISPLTRIQPGRMIVAPATMSFKQKIDLMASTVSKLKEVLSFNTGPAPTHEVFGELRHICVQADALYREIIGARWGCRGENCVFEILGSHSPTSDQNEEPLGALDAHKLLDIADFIYLVQNEIETFFLEPEILVPESA